MRMAEIKLLFVDDDDALRTALGAVLTHHGFALTAVSSVPEALELISTRKFDVLLSDLNIGQPGDGFTVVSAMRRVQPDACAFIRPAILTWKQPFRYSQPGRRLFLKAVHVERLVKAISDLLSGRRTINQALPTRRVAQILATFLSHLRPLAAPGDPDPELSAIPLTQAERSDHLPDMMEELIRRLEGPQEELSDVAADAARKHGRLRYQQGYTIPQILFEARVLQHVLTSAIRTCLASTSAPWLAISWRSARPFRRIGNIHPRLSVAVRALLQTSFSSFYRSPYLGITIAERPHHRRQRRLSRMIGQPRALLVEGSID